jgi:HEAT repeat protein
VALSVVSARGLADEVQTRDGHVYRGTVERLPSNALVVHAKSGDVRLDLADVVTIFEAHAAPASPSTAAPAPPTSNDAGGDGALRQEVDRLRAFFADRSPDRHEQAARALTALGRPAVPYVIDAFERSAPPETTWLAWVLRDVGDVRAVDPLVRKLAGADASLQAALLDCLKRFHDSRGFDAATPIAASGKGEAKQRAFELIAQSGDPRATPLLLKGLADSNAWIREASEDALRATIDGGGGAPLFDPLTRDLTLADDDVAESIVRLLARLRDPRVVEPIAEVLERENPKPRRTATHVLGQLADRRACEPLQRALEDDDAAVRCEALKALARIRSREAFPLMVDRLVDAEGSVRVAARAALVNLAGCDEGPDREGWIRWWSRNGEL